MNNGQPFGNEEEDDAKHGGFDPRPINLSGGSDPRMINLGGSDSRMINLSSGNDPRMINLSGGDSQLINLNGGNDSPLINLNGGDPHMIQLRADGGPVRKGRPYLMGERGPELVMPRKAEKKGPGAKKPSGRRKGAALDCVPGTKEKKSAWFARLARSQKQPNAKTARGGTY